MAAAPCDEISSCSLLAGRSSPTGSGATIVAHRTDGEADPAELYRLYSFRAGIEHCDKPAKHELGWADFQVGAERAIVRHWHVVLLAFTASLLTGTATTGDSSATVAPSPPGVPAAAPLTAPPRGR